MEICKEAASISKNVGMIYILSSAFWPVDSLMKINSLVFSKSNCYLSGWQ
jgi:hypothetical protein